MRTCQNTAAAAAVAAAALIASAARHGWMAIAAGCLAIAAIAVVLLDAAIETRMARHAPGKRPAKPRLAAAIAALVASAAAVGLALVLAFSAVPPLDSSVPGQPTALAPAPVGGQGSSPVPASPTAVEFIISGYAPAGPYGGKPVIDYGFSQFTGGAQPDQINGTIIYNVPFSWAAHSYFLNVFLAGAGGHVTCTIVLLGPSPDRPATLSSAAAAGELATCSAQATPAEIFSGWLSWLGQRNGVTVLGQQGYPPPASASTRRYGTPGQIAVGA
jgi:hypothetical protein